MRLWKPRVRSHESQRIVSKPYDEVVKSILHIILNSAGTYIYIHIYIYICVRKKYLVWSRIDPTDGASIYHFRRELSE